MSKQFSEDELLEFSKEIFKQHPDVGFLYACGDGNFFRDRDQNHATNFARESKQDLKRIELVGSMPRIIGAAEPEDPMTRDVTALMSVLNVTEDKARELITEHRGNTAAAVQAARQEPAAEAKPAARTSKSKKAQNGTT